MEIIQLSDIDLQTLRTELESGIRLSSPIFCPHNIWKLMQSCWKSNPDTRPSFKQLKASLWQDIHFPKISDNVKEEDTIYQAILGDTSMKKKFNAICKNNTAYLQIKNQSSSDDTEGLGMSAGGFVHNGTNETATGKEIPKRHTVKVSGKEEEINVNPNDEIQTTELHDLSNQCTNDTYLTPIVSHCQAMKNERRRSESSYPDVVEENLMVHAQNIQVESGELSMLIKYNTLPHTNENKQKSSLTQQDVNPKYEATSRSYETIFSESKNSPGFS